MGNAISTCNTFSYFAHNVIVILSFRVLWTEHYDQNVMLNEKQKESH